MPDNDLDLRVGDHVLWRFRRRDAWQERPGVVVSVRAPAYPEVAFLDGSGEVRRHKVTLPHLRRSPGAAPAVEAALAEDGA